MLWLCCCCVCSIVLRLQFVKICHVFVLVCLYVGVVWFVFSVCVLYWFGVVCFVVCVLCFVCVFWFVSL